MKKNIWIFLLSFIMVGFASCSKDDDNDNVDIKSKIIGTWIASNESINRTVTVKFKSDGTGTLSSEYHGKTGRSNSETKGSFTWSCSGKKVKTYGQYTYVDYKDGSVDIDYDPEVDYNYDGNNLKGGRYPEANLYTKK